VGSGGKFQSETKRRKTMATMTANQGAAQTRASIKAKLLRLRKNQIQRHLAQLKEIDAAIIFIEGQADRNTARKGGLGRR